MRKQFNLTKYKHKKVSIYYIPLIQKHKLANQYQNHTFYLSLWKKKIKTKGNSTNSYNVQRGYWGKTFKG